MSLLQVKEVTHTYSSSHLFWRPDRQITVLSNVSLSIEQGMCMGLLGTSGAGKSTLGKVILGLLKPQKGRVLFQGQDLYNMDPLARKRLRRDLQVVFQDCYSSVNPRMTAEQIIGEPLENYERLSASEQKRRIAHLLDIVGLNSEDMRKYPRQFSGGQLQRINIARAIALNPKLIILDESVSSLDMVNQTLILSLLSELKSVFGLSYLFITHDIKAAYFISDALAVMEKGELVQMCYDKNQILTSQHPAVKNLISSILSEHPRYRSIFPGGNPVRHIR
ncbi:nickel import ATP-binding protein NikE [Aneurinibacillus migulanus]|uniref:Nickel ABC transporter ATP-binding protein n=1 Tax=Aneurinibacillus migulanus TaxID=47500 RepID=A0A0D1VAD9_ANEMI|nr:nickel import ATP-binding protein NikE [Aneurinibacillus migulanus]KIV56409.1 nickel ABC transporter ATP-binding protein [Aneurinibacillus migulanus]KON97725.1 nickel ABC transporter ATP-binding protein [Aneurinibacillus migulanus]MED0896173.1 nickel import ATP-binding protein NikE [Aneurinibacillus migulanus]MED1619795.1 nickel import ATP-binding protein NikE [Aneurinibacillus migulanus]SDK51712.1 nickel transport system ATP-binding protein [Aneurinibacillus migulanus]